MTVDTLVRDAALSLLAGGVSIIPTSRGDKRPVNRLLPMVPDEKTGEPKPSWKPFQSEAADAVTARGWFDKGCGSYAGVCGKVSGGLLVIDFDVPRFYEAW